MTTSNLCLLAFLLLQAADAATTTYGIRNGLKETNPVMRFMIAKLGLYVGQLAIRLPIIAMVSYFALTGGLEDWAMIALVVPFAALLANNLYWLRKFRTIEYLPPKGRLWSRSDKGVLFFGQYVVTHYRIVSVRRWATREQALADIYFPHKASVKSN